MSKQSEAVKKWRNKTKDLILRSMGSKCVICEYNRSSSALELHHLDKTTKSFSFGGLRARPMAWPVVVEELKKCILVCSNCHREIEAGLIDVSLISSTYDDTQITFNIMQETRNTSLRICTNSNCKKSFRVYNSNQLYCSIPCRQTKSLNNIRKHPIRKTKIQWPGSAQLKKMVDEFGYVKVGNRLGVSDNAVRKRLKKYSRVA